MDNNTATPANHISRTSAKNTAKKRNFKRLAVLIGAVILVLASAGLVISLLSGDKPRSDRYQAVFLDNNQVFFGKLKNTTGNYLTLEKAYYTKAAELPADATKEQKAATDSNVSLLKVGSEVYGPEDTLKIRAEQVLFWQDLTTDSKVAKAIDSAK